MTRAWNDQVSLAREKAQPVTSCRTGIDDVEIASMALWRLVFGSFTKARTPADILLLCEGIGIPVQTKVSRHVMTSTFQRSSWTLLR